MVSAQIFALVPIIAVMFTFSFGSAFAAVPYEAKAAEGNILYQVDDVKANGEYGVTGAEKAKVIAAIEELYDDLTTGNNYYAKEQAAAKELIAQAVKDAEAATTAKALNAVKTDLVTALNKLKAAVADAKTAFRADTTTATIDLTRLAARYPDKDFVLEGYGKFATSDFPAADGKNLVTTGSSTALKDIVVDGDLKFVEAYLLDNGYLKAYQISDGISALIAALKPVNDDYTKAAAAEKNTIQDKVWAYADKYSATARDNRLTVADIDGMFAVIGEMNDYADKYTAAGINVAFKTTEFKTAYDAMVAKYFDAFDSETIKIPEVAKLTDADKATVIALYDKIDAYYDEFVTNHDDDVFTIPAKAEIVEDYTYVANAYGFFKDADQKAFAKLDAFEEIKVTDGKGYFDDAEKNVKALEAQRKAYDEYVKNYGYGDLTADDVAAEAKIVVAEHNKTLAAGYDEKADELESSKVQAYLNNATVKVTTKALGNKKVRVQATVDTVSFEKILNAMEDGCKVEYQFYYKKAASTTYKAGKVKDVNYTTFKLAKGVKYNFQCKVVFKDADGNVVATKDYKGSTVGTRTVK